MNITDLTQKLLSDSERQASDKGFTDSYSSFIEFLNNLKSFAVYFDTAHNYANTANTAFLTRRIIEETGIDKSNIKLIYDEKLKEKIRENLPDFENYGKNIEPEFIICGGSEQDDPFWGTLGTNVKFVMTIRPYLDGGDFCFIKIRNEKDENTPWITYFTDTIIMNQPFVMRNFYINIDKIKTIPEEIKTYYSKSYKNLDKAEKILNSTNASVFTINGLKAENSASDRGDNCVLILALASLAKLKSDNQTAVLVFTDYADENDSHFSLLKSFCNTNKDSVALLDELKTKYPQPSAEELKAGLLNPLLNKRSEFNSVLDKIKFWNDSESFESGKLYICPLGKLPYDYMAALYAKSSFVFFESCDYTNLAINLGVPFLQKSIETEFAYPGFFNPTDATNITELCNIFGNDISAYSSGFNKNINEEINKISEFLKNPKQEYFNSLKNYAQNILNDKLAASGGIFDMLRKEMSGQCEKHVLLRNNDAENIEEFEELHKKLQDNFDEKNKTLNITEILSNMRIGKYFESLANGSFIITLNSKEDIVLDRYEADGEEEEEEEREVCGVSIKNAKAAEFPDWIFEINFTDWYGGDSYGVYINGNSNQSNTLFNLPWLKFSDANFSVITSENNMPTKGSVGATFGRTEDYYGVNFVIDFNYQDNLTRIMATFKEPLTAFDAFGAIAGGLDFVALLPQQLIGFVSLGLSELVFYYDKGKNEITSMSFSFANSADKPWILWEDSAGKPILTASPSIGVTVNSPMDMANRQVLLSIGAFVDFGGKEEIEANGEIGQLYLSASYPPFVAQMRMASEEIDIDKLLGLFGVKSSLNFKITDLSILADFGNKHYKLSAAINSDWEIIKDKFTVTGLALHIADKAGKFSIGFAGSMRICNKVDVAVAVGYDNGNYKLAAKLRLNNDLSMSELVEYYTGSNQIELTKQTDDVSVAGLDFWLEKSNSGTKFEISVFVDEWEISAIDKKVSAIGKIGNNGNNYYASLKASIELLGGDFIISLDYNNSAGLYLEWGDYSGEIIDDAVSIKLKNFSIGEMIETFIGWYYGSKFSLDSPWDILNKITLDIELTYTQTESTKEFKITVGLTEEPSLGFGTLKSISVVYNPNNPNNPNADKKIIDVKLKVAYAWGTVEELTWDASKPGTAPAPAGKGNKYFDLRYLALGQKIEFFKGGHNPKNTDEAIEYLITNTEPDKFPNFNKNSGMLVAANFGVLKSESTDTSGNVQYFLDAALVFYDPALFSVRIKFAGPAAKILDGFLFEIIYAKISEALGVFKSTIILPNKFRRFDLGAYTITMPDFYIEIYTNGDFKIDVGFPQNLDFSRSFSLSGMIGPIPVTGAAGFYFGKLSSASAESSGIYLPQYNLAEAQKTGNFNPAIIFGAGLRIGIGKSINYGILSGGFSLTVAVMLEGVMAKWNPYFIEKNEKEDWYYKLKGTAALIGEVYGKVDFVIISASVNIKISIAVDFIYESYRATALTICAYVSASASLTINLWLFKIKISFHFEVKVKESFVIGDDTTAPWDVNRIAGNNTLLFAYAKAVRASSMDFSNLELLHEKITIDSNLSLALTAAADEYDSTKKHLISNVMLTVKNDNFKSFAEILIYWIIAASYGRKVNKNELSTFKITDNYLAGIEAYLENETMPISVGIAENFLKDFFIIDIKNSESDNSSIESTYFPLPPNTKFKNGKTEYKLKEYNSISENATRIFKEIFKELSVIVEEEEAKDKLSLSNNELSLSEFVFCDYFSIAASYIVRTMREKLRDEKKEFLTLEKIMEDNKFSEHLSGMLSRFFLHGLRFPTVYEGEKLITPLKQGLWVSGSGNNLTLPPEAGIFALTGQAFELTVNDDNDENEISVSSDDEFFKLPKDFSLKPYPEEEKDKAVKALKAIKEYAENFKIEHTSKNFEAEFVPAVISFSNPIKINDNKYIWTVPESLAQYFNNKSKFDLCFTKYDDNGEIQKRSEALSSLALIEFSISQTDINGVYFIKSASQKTISILREIITSDVKIKTLELLNVSELFKNAEDSPFFAISQINMSTETRPPDENLMKAASNDNIDTLKLLWKALVTNNGGYILTYRDGEEIKLDDKITLTVNFDFEFANADNYLPLINAVSFNEYEESEVLTAFAKDDNIGEKQGQSENTSSKVNENYIIQRVLPGIPELPEIPDAGTLEGYAKAVLENNYSLLRYRVKSGDTVSPYSAPYSFETKKNNIEYNITAPVDKIMGGGYNSVGKSIESEFNWLDYYGNKLASEFSLKRTAGYQDKILGLSKWQSISASWQFKIKTEVSVTLNFSENDYKNDYKNENARKSALAFYLNLLSQIEDGNLNIYLKCSVFCEISDKLDKTNLIGKIKEIIAFLNGEINEINELIIDFSFANKEITESKLFSLECSFVMKRSESTGEGYEEVKDILSTESAVNIHNDLSEFSKSFKTAFNNEYIILKGGSGNCDIYAYKKSTMNINIGKEREIFLPKPIANTLIDRDGVGIKTYENRNLSDSPINKNYRAVDLNIWFRNALKFADNIISAEIASAAVLVDYGEKYNELLHAKKEISEKLTGLLSPAFAGSSSNICKEAKELFKQRMLGSLSSYYGVKAIIVLPTEVSGLPDDKSVFFGNLTDLNNDNNLSYSSPKIKNGENQMVFAVSGADIVLDKNGAVLPKAELKPTYSISHIEGGIEEIMDGFNASQWYGKTDENIADIKIYEEKKTDDEDDKSSQNSIPLPLYDFPETPVMVSQEDKTKQDDDKYSWRYAFTYSRSYNYPQQTCNCTVKYNTIKETLNTSASKDVFTTLAQIDEAGAAIYKDLLKTAEEINRNTNIFPETDKADEFKTAFVYAKTILSDLAEAEFICSNYMKFANKADKEEISFSVKEDKIDGRDIFCITIINLNGAEPQIEGYESENITDKNNTWIFRNDKDEYLSFADGQKINKRKIVMPPKKILQYKNAVSEIFVKQNETLCDKKMNDAFIYTTPLTAFDSAFNVSRVVEDVDLSKYKDENKTSLLNILLKYLKDLCEGNSITIQARGTYLSNKLNKVASVVYPIFSQGKKQIKSDEELEKLVGGWLAALNIWRKNFSSKEFTKEEMLSFEFVFFSDLNSTPLLTIKNAYISGEFITL